MFLAPAVGLLDRWARGVQWQDGKAPARTDGFTVAVIGTGSTFLMKIRPFLFQRVSMTIVS